MTAYGEYLEIIGEGAVAFDRDYLITDNPYKGKDTEKALSWNRGFANAAATWLMKEAEPKAQEVF